MPENYTCHIACSGLFAAGGLSGGVSASMADGDFWDGLCNGLICAGLNHAMHLACAAGEYAVKKARASNAGPDDPPGKSSSKKVDDKTVENINEANTIATGQVTLFQLATKCTETTNGIDLFTKYMNKLTTKSGKVLGYFGTGLSLYQCLSATDVDLQLEYGVDALISLAGAVAPEVIGPVSAFWFLGGKQLVNWHTRTVIQPMIENGINPGLPAYQPFK